MRHDHHHRTSTEKIEDEPSHYYEGDVDPHDEVVRLEALIEELADKVENCRKFILASRISRRGAAASSSSRCSLTQSGSILE
jgi:hypothetical protein